MDLPIKSWLDEVLLQVQTHSPGKVLFWGDGLGGISSYVAGWMAGRGIDVILLDGATRFNPYMVSSFARKALIPPERLLKSIRIARAFTCYQMATLMGERLVSLLRARTVGAIHESPLQKPWVILLGPLTTFLDEDVPEREVRPLFERSLRKVEKIAMEGIPFFLFQPNHPNLPLVKSVRLETERGEGRFMSSRRVYLTKRLLQFSDLVWKISVDDRVPKLILEKGLIENNSLNPKHEIRNSKQIPMTKA